MNLNIRNFPEDLHRRLKAASALNGKTLREVMIGLADMYVRTQGLWEVNDGTNRAVFNDLVEALESMLPEEGDLTIRRI